MLLLPSLGKAPFDNAEEMILRTFGMMRQDATAYLNLVEQIGPEKAKAKANDFFDQVNLPLIHGEDDQLVLDVVDLSELHLFLGVTNKLFDSLYKIMIEDVDNKWHRSVYDWAHDKHIVPN